VSSFQEPLIESIHKLWFGPLHGQGEVAPEKQQQWFRKDPEFDALIRKHYLEYIDPAFMGGFDRWTLHDEGLVALIILLDQFPRNMFRDTPRAFSYDKKALSLVYAVMNEDRYLKMPSVFAYFCLMPTMHSEFLDVQDRGLEAFGKLLAQTDGPNQDLIARALQFAEAHRQIIARFGRFPHRNELLGRASSAEEIAFLQEPGSRF
jgi:uncharacterized protein (DUF924 family)